MPRVGPAPVSTAPRLAPPRRPFRLALPLARPQEIAPARLEPTKEVASLRAAVRVLPLAVVAALRAHAPGLSLELGRALSVELRPAPGAAVELVLRPAPALARVAAAELPALVKTLRERGVRVTAASVRAR